MGGAGGWQGLWGSSTSLPVGSPAVVLRNLTCPRRQPHPGLCLTEVPPWSHSSLPLASCALGTRARKCPVPATQGHPKGKAGWLAGSACPSPAPNLLASWMPPWDGPFSALRHWRGTEVSPWPGGLAFGGLVSRDLQPLKRTLTAHPNALLCKDVGTYLFLCFRNRWQQGAHLIYGGHGSSRARSVTCSR